MFYQMKNNKDKVKFLLKKTPHLRDNDYKLIATFWHHELGGRTKLDLMSGYDMLRMFSEGKLTSPETIRRVRQKIQEQTPDLRGSSYKKRKEEATHIRDNIRHM